MDYNTYKTILVTGIGGFIGSHMVRELLLHTDSRVIGIESWKPAHKNDSYRLRCALGDVPAEDARRLKIIRHDLTHEFSPPLVEKIRSEADGKVDAILNIASDSRVTYSISHPGETWHNNTALIYNMLELARELTPQVFLQVSTDEVYGDVDWSSAGHPEWDVILPSNPYSASKAAQEALAIAYWRTYDVPLVLTNTMNVIGEWQDPEKFLPKVIKRVMRGEPVELHKDRESGRLMRRVWLDVRNVVTTMQSLLLNVKPTRYEHAQDRPERFHLIGNDELSVREIAERVALSCGKSLEAKEVDGSSVRPGYDRRYAMQSTRMPDNVLQNVYSFEDTIERIVSWAKENNHWLFE